MIDGPEADRRPPAPRRRPGARGLACRCWRSSPRSLAPATWYFRWRTAEPAIVGAVRDAGHEVGPHYETLTRWRSRGRAPDGDAEAAATLAACRDVLRAEIRVSTSAWSDPVDRRPRRHAHPAAAQRDLLADQDPRAFALESTPTSRDPPRPPACRPPIGSAAEGEWKDGSRPARLIDEVCPADPVRSTHPNNWAPGPGSGRAVPRAPRAGGSGGSPAAEPGRVDELRIAEALLFVGRIAPVSATGSSSSNRSSRRPIPRSAPDLDRGDGRLAHRLAALVPGSVVPPARRAPGSSFDPEAPRADARWRRGARRAVGVVRAASECTDVGVVISSMPTRLVHGHAGAAGASPRAQQDGPRAAGRALSTMSAAVARPRDGDRDPAGDPRGARQPQARRRRPRPSGA